MPVGPPPTTVTVPAGPRRFPSTTTLAFTMQDAPADSPLSSGRERPSILRQPLPAWVKPALRIGVTIIVVATVLRSIDVPDLVSILKRCDWRWWFAGFALGITTTVITGIRWAFLARPIGFALPIGTFVWRFFEGQFFNLVLPSSIGGDVVKAYRLSHSTHGRLLAGCTVLADRLTGVSALGILAITALAAQKYALGTAGTLAIGAGLLGATILGFWLVVGSIDRVLRWIPPEQHAAREFLSRLMPYQKQPSLMTWAVGWSLVVQFGGAAAVGLVAHGLGVSLPLAVWCSAIPLVALTMVLPITINGVGIREGGLAFLLGPHGVSADQAVAIGLLWFLCNVLGGLIGGLLFILDRAPGDALDGAGDGPRTHA